MDVCEWLAESTVGEWPQKHVLDKSESKKTGKTEMMVHGEEPLRGFSLSPIPLIVIRTTRQSNRTTRQNP